MRVNVPFLGGMKRAAALAPAVAQYRARLDATGTSTEEEAQEAEFRQTPRPERHRLSAAIDGKPIREVTVEHRQQPVVRGPPWLEG